MLFVLIPYLVFLLLFLLFSLVAIYHLRRFGFAGDKTRLAILIYSVFSAAVIFFTFMYIIGLNWSAGF